MKGMKKLLSILMVLTLVLSLGAMAFAAETPKTVSIQMNEKEGNAANGTYVAYQLFTLTTTEGSVDGGSGYSYTVNEKYRSIMYTAAGIEVTGNNKTDDKALLEYLDGLDDAAVRNFADAVYKAILKAAEDGTPIEADYKATAGVFTVPQGYYLIAETSAEGGATSQVMLDTAGRQDITVTTKEEKPSSDKKLKETNDTVGKVTNWQDGADYDIGDKIPYRLSATIPNEHYADYETYYLQFVDDMCQGLGDPENVRIYWVAAEHVAESDKAEYQNDITSFFPGGAVRTTQTSKYTKDGAVGTVYTFTCEDIKTAGVPAGATVYVEYQSELLPNAVIGGEGNPNDSHIVYSDNPYGEGTSRTPDDKVCVFTFTIEAQKVGEDEVTPLDGAGFTLLKEIAASFVPSDKTPTAITDPEDLGDLTTGTYVTYNGKTYVVAHEEITGETMFDFKGQDSGNYVLVETTVPAGYNKADDIVFTVVATYDENNVQDPKLKDLKCDPSNAKFTCTTATGVVDTTVINRSGVELPETGGIGTTIFYIAGAILVAGAVILLVTKKRVSGMEK